MTNDTNDLTYAEALQAAQPRIAEARASLTALSDQAQAYIRDAAAALRAWMARMAPLFARMWQRIVA